VLEHFDRPFPLPEEKDMLSRLTGLPRAQVLDVAVLGGNTCVCTAGAL
jgi:Homeobox KN domain